MKLLRLFYMTLAMFLVVGPAYGACLSRPQHDGAYYRYRIIDHHRCWYPTTRTVKRHTNQRRVVQALYPAGERGAVVRQHYRAADTHHPRTRKAGEADTSGHLSAPDNTEPRSVTVGAGLPEDIWTPAEQIEMRWP